VTSPVTIAGRADVFEATARGLYGTIGYREVGVELVKEL